jgi:hypothetical protein
MPPKAPFGSPFSTGVTRVALVTGFGPGLIRGSGELKARRSHRAEIAS